jgi:hypothetical protein
MFIVSKFYELVKDLAKVEPLKLFLLHIPNPMFKPSGVLKEHCKPGKCPSDDEGAITEPRLLLLISLLSYGVL